MTTSLTIKTVTAIQNRQLKSEAIEHGADRQRAICDLALGYAVAYDHTSGKAVLLDMEQDEAVAFCVDVINNARAQAEGV